MYAQQITVNATNEYPLVPSNLYSLFAEKYNLPKQEELYTLADTNLNTELRHIYVLDDYRALQDNFLLEYRVDETRAWNEIRLSIKDGNIIQLTFKFNARGDRNISSHIIASLKSIAEKQNIELEYLDLFIEGTREDTGSHAREKWLSSFKWYESIHRYLHKLENIDNLRHK